MEEQMSMTTGTNDGGLKKIYDKSVKDGYKGSYDDFTTYFNASDENRRRVYDKNVKNGYKGSYDDFISFAGEGQAKTQPTRYQLPTFQPYQREINDSPASIMSPTQLKIARGEIGEGDTYTLQPGENPEEFSPIPNYVVGEERKSILPEQEERPDIAALKGVVSQKKPLQEYVADKQRQRPKYAPNPVGLMQHEMALTRLAKENGIATDGFENLNELGEDAMKIYALTPQGKADKQNMENAAQLAYDDFAADYLKNGSDADIKAQLELGKQRQALEQENAALAKDIEAWKAHHGTEQQLNALNARIRDLNKRIGEYEAAVAQSDKAQEKVNEAFQKWLDNDDYYKAVAKQYEQNYEATMGDWFDSAATPLYMQMTKDEIAKMKAYLDDENLNLDYRQRTAIKRRVRDAEAWVKAAEKNGWLDKTFAGMQGKGAGIDIATMFRGMGNSFTLDRLSFGIGDALDAWAVEKAMVKVRDQGVESLTPEEKALLESDAVLDLTRSVFNIDESAFNAGATTMEMLPFIAELWLSGGALGAVKGGVKGTIKGGVKGTIKGGVKGTIKGGAKGFGKGWKAGWKAAMKPTASQLGRLGEAGRFAPKPVGQVAKEVGMTAAEIVDNGLFYALTTGSGHSIANTLEYMTPEMDSKYDFGTGEMNINGVAVDEQGNIKGGDKMGLAALKGFGMQAIEGGSEMLGEKALQPLLDRGGYWLRGMMGRQGRAMYKPYLRVVDDWIGHGALKNVSGFGIEYAEELAGSVMRVITGLSTWDQEFNKQNLADTAYGLMPAQVAFAILGGGRMVGHARRSSQAKDLLDKYAPEQAAFYDRVAQMSTYDGADMLDRRTLDILETIDKKRADGTLTQADEQKAAAELGMIFATQEQLYMDEAAAYMDDKKQRSIYEGITSNINKDNGKFTVANWTHDGQTERVAVLSTKDGKATIKANGKKHTVDAKDISVQSEYTPEQAVELAAEANEEDWRGMANDDQTTPMAGTIYYDAEGNTPIVPGGGRVMVTEVADDGDVTFETEAGRKQTMSRRQFYDYMRALRENYESTAGEIEAWQASETEVANTTAKSDNALEHQVAGQAARDVERLLAKRIGADQVALLNRMDVEGITRVYLEADDDTTRSLISAWLQTRTGTDYHNAMAKRKQDAVAGFKQSIGRLAYDNSGITTAEYNGNTVAVESNDGSNAVVVGLDGSKTMVPSASLANMQPSTLDAFAEQAVAPQLQQADALERVYDGTVFNEGQVYDMGIDKDGKPRKVAVVSVNPDGTISYATNYGWNKDGSLKPDSRSVNIVSAEDFRDMLETANEEAVEKAEGERQAAQQRADMGSLKAGQRVVIMDGGKPVGGVVMMPYTGQQAVFTDTQKLINFDTMDDLKKSMQDAANASNTQQQAAVEAVANRINELANAMPNARIKVVTDINELRPDAQEFARKGQLEAYFDPDTNTVVFYAPGLVANNSNVDGKVIHEVIIHYGLKNMLGEKDYAALCLNIFNNVMDENDRVQYVQYVKDSHPNSNLTDEQIMAMAADEWLAFTYENRDIDSIKRNNLLQTIVDFIVDLFKKAGVDLNRDEVMAELDQLVAASRDWLRGEQVNQEEKKEEAPKEEEKKEEPQPEPTKTREELIANAVEAAANFAAQGDPNFVKDNLDKAKKRVSNAKKRKPTSTDPAKRQEQIEKINTELAAAENELAFWNDVRAVINEAQLADQTRLNEADQALQDLDKNLVPTVEAEEVHKFDKEPANADEAAADFLVGFVKKEHRINEQSLMQETGWSKDEVKNFRPATTPDGGMTLQEAAENLYNEYESEGSEHGWFKDPSEARDKLISVMQEAGKYGEFANYINQRRGNDEATQQMQAALDANAQQLGYADAQDMHDKRMAEAQDKLEELKDEQGNLSEEALQQFKDFTQGLMIGQEETPAEQPTESIEGEGEYYQPTNEEAPFSVVTSEDAVRYSIVTDPKEIERLDNEPKEVGYRTVILNEDGTLGSPMATSLGKKGTGRAKTSGFEFGRWEQAEEHPELATENGKIDLIKDNNDTVGGVDYNPYIHIRPNLVNKQFKQAWERPNLVYVRTQYPASELTSGYKADKAKKSVGRHDWNGGELILSRWDKPVEIVPWEEVADDWMQEFGDKPIHFDIIPPQLLPILASRGANIVAPHKNMGKACNDAYNEWKNGESILPIDQQTPKNTTIDQVLYSIKVNHNSPYLLKKADGSFIDPETGERLGFDHRFMSNGEGAQAHGWGSYFSVNDLRSYAGQVKNDIYYQGKLYDVNEVNNHISEVGQRALNWFLYGVEPDKYTNDKDGMLSIIDKAINSYEVLWSGEKDDYYNRQIEQFKDMRKFVEEHGDEIRIEPQRHHYNVEIPDNDGTNYFEESEPLKPEQIAMLQKQSDKEGAKAEVGGFLFYANPEKNPYADKYTFRKFLSDITSPQGGITQKQASEFFSRAGFVGTHYDGKRDGECYVIFDENDAKIVDHVMFSVTENNAIFADIINEQGELNYDKLNEHIQRVKDGTERVSRLSEEEIGREDATPSIAAQAIARGVRDSRLADLWGTDRAREQTRLLIKEWAKKNKYWYGKTRLEKDATERKGNNKESRVFISNDYSIVRKLTKPFLYGSTQPLIEAIESFGSVFPETAYTIKGFAENKDGQLCVVTEQPYIDGVPLSQAYPDATEREKVLTDFMEDLGFNHYGYGVYGNNIVGVYDLHGGNVIVDANGDLFVIDAIIRTSQRHFGDDVLFSVVTPQQDADYMDAVNRGDMETAQRMVMEAAKAAMPNTKVVDENGNPLVVYHGTRRAGFTIFNIRPSDLKGIFFANTKEAARDYSKSLNEVFLPNFKSGDIQGALKWLNDLNVTLGLNDSFTYEEYTDEYGSHFKLINVTPAGNRYDEFEADSEEEFTDEIINQYNNNIDAIYPSYLNLKNPLVIDANGSSWREIKYNNGLYTTDSLVQRLKREGEHDGLIVHNVYDSWTQKDNHGMMTDYIAFYPDQVKISSPVTYDDNGNVIPLSERFNEGNDDIRYSVSPEQDEAYRKAYEEGDRKAARQMVREAAAQAMPNTKVVDENGLPLVVYHGTDLRKVNNDNPFYVFKENSHFGTWSQAEDILYGSPMTGVVNSKIYEAYLNITNPKRVEDQPADWYQTPEEYWKPIIEQAKSEGYDGIVYENKWEGRGVEYGEGEGEDSYIAFSPNQIKSAEPFTFDDNGELIPLSQRFNPNNNDIRYSFVGRSGAQRLDMADRSMTRLNNLHVAREMEEQGKDAKAVKMATGWERGKDGKWRYEIAEANMEDIVKRMREPILPKIEEIKRLKELAKQEYERFEYLDRTIPTRLDSRYTEEQKKKYREQRKERDQLMHSSHANEADAKTLEDELRNDGVEMTLGEILPESNELLKAYPQLANIKVKYYNRDTLRDGSYGGYIDKEKAILLAGARPLKDTYSTLYHEIQHAIQYIEGFAEGGNPARAAQAVKDMDNNAKVWGYKLELDDVAKEHPEHADNEQELLYDILFDRLRYENDGQAEYNAEKDGWIPDENIRKQAFKVYQGRIKGDTYEKAYNQWYDKLNEAGRTTYYEGTPFELYKRLAGETEARNVQTRLGFTDEQRHQLLAAETEDVAREDQLVMFAGDPVLYSVAKNANTPQERMALYDALVGTKNETSTFVGRTMENAYQYILDGAIPLKRLQTVVAGRNGVKDAENAYLMEIARASRAKYLTDQAEKKYMQPMMDAIADLTGKQNKRGFYKAMRDVELYVLAKSGLERNQWFWDEAKKKDPKAQLEDKSGLTALAAQFGETDFTAFAERLVAEYEAKHGKQKIDNLWNAIRNMSHNILDTERDGMLISAELCEDLKNRWQYYVPMRGFDEDVTSSVYSYDPSSANIRFENPFKKIKGRVSLADNPFVNLWRMTESAINLKGKNEVGLALLTLASNHPDNGLLRVGKSWETRFIDPNTGEEKWMMAYPNLANVSQKDIPAAIDAFQKSMVRMAKNGDARQSNSRTAGGMRIFPTDMDQHTLKVTVAGQSVDLYLMGNPKAFQALNPKGKSRTAQAMSALTRGLSGLMTTYNPVFMVRNSMRDLGTATIITYTRDGVGGMATMLGQWFGNANRLRRLISGKSSGDVTIDQYWNEFLEFGGETGFTRNLAMEKARDEFMKDMRNATRKGINPNLVFHAYGNWMENYGNRFAEDITRFAVFCASRKQGKSAMQAAADAKNTTANFNKKGNSAFTRFMTSNFAFFNAALQGLNTTFHAYKDNPGRAAVASVSTMAFSMAVPFINMLMLAAWGDDDDWRQYENMTQFIGNTHLVVYIPKVGFATLPFPQDFVPLTALGNIIWRNAAGFSNIADERSIAGNIMLEWASTMADLLPVNMFEEGFGKIEDWEGVARAVAPTWLSPVADVMLNRNFMGSMIRRKHFLANGQKDLKPYWAEYDRNKSEWAYELAKLIAGGDEYRAAAEWRNIDPRQIIHIVEGYGGGTVKLISDAANYATARAKGENASINQSPFIKKFWIQPQPDKYEGNLNGKLYEMAKHQRDMEQELKSLQKEADKAYDDGNDALAEKREKEIERIENSIEYQVLSAYDVNGMMESWREQRNDITADEELSDEGKQEQIRSLTYEKAAFLDGIWEELFLNGDKSNWFSEFYYDKKKGE